jgi:hypothetical protein
MLRADRGLSVELEGERRVRLDPADPRSAGFAQILDGLRKPKKVWIQGNLYVSTKNHPDCEVWWNWHVAPTLCVRGPGLFQKQDMVIDPALFATPVSKTMWKGVQSDPTAILTYSDASDYLWGITDPSYTATNQKLAFYRLQLQNRAIEHGPPPYATCP